MMTDRSRPHPHPASDAPGQTGVVSASPSVVVTASSPAVAARMARQRRRDTVPEVELRRRLHAAGLRFRVDAPLPGLARRRADVLFTRARIAVFVDGCFWHGCPVHGTLPVANGAWWADKLAGNVARDRATDAHLEALGWSVVRFWEHDDPDIAAAVVRRAWSERVGDVAGEPARTPFREGLTP